MNTIQVLPIEDPGAKRPLWSVVIPTYNCAEYLKQTIQSVLIQDRGIEDMEIWVVDDCSADNPERVVHDLGKGRIRFYQQKENVGQLNNFSTCLNLATGKIIHLLHGDDLVHDGFYESLGNGLILDNSVGAAFSSCNLIDKNGKVIITSDVLADSAGVIQDFLSIITKKQVIQTPSIVVKREVYEKLGAFNRNLTWVEDWEMWIRIACSYQFYYVPAVLASYRIHSSSNTENSIKTGRFVKDGLKFIEVFSAYLKIPEKQKKKIVHATKQHFLDFAAQQSNTRLSVAILFRSFPLVYNVRSFFAIMNHIPKIMIKRNLRILKTFMRSNK